MAYTNYLSFFTGEGRDHWIDVNLAQGHALRAPSSPGVLKQPTKQAWTVDPMLVQC